MIVGQIAEVLYAETQVELECNDKLVYSGEASSLTSTKFCDRKVKEVYIGIQGHTLVLVISGVRESKHGCR